MIAPSPRVQRGVYLVLAYFLSALLGVRTALPLYGQPITDLLFALTVALTVTYLCIADSLVLHRPLIRTARWIMVFFWPVAAPIYVLWSRRAWGILVLLIHFVLLAATYYASYVFAFVLRQVLMVLMR
jgi:hypothetical protein